METLKFYGITLVFLAIFVAIGYYAYIHLDRGQDYVAVVEESGERQEVTITPISESVTEEEVPEPDQESLIADPPIDEPSALAEYPGLIADLQELIEDRVVMDTGSNGSRVGTVQKALNVYFDERISVDNDYGPNTKERVRRFQSAEGLSADGQAGPSTYQALIDYLSVL